MKKYLFFLAIISVMLTGCVSTNVERTDNGNSLRMDAYENKTDENANKANDLKNETAPVKETVQEVKNTSSMNNEKQEDLTAEYQYAILKTSKGDIKVKFYGTDSPKTVNNFMSLAKEGFYNGVKFHRVIKDFMIQSGDPLSKDNAMKARWGTGGPGYAFADEFNAHKLVRGSLAMANSGPNTNGSQFFIVTLDATPWLDGKHTNFGEVVEGMNVVDAIEASQTEGPDRPVVDIEIKSIELVK